MLVNADSVRPSFLHTNDDAVKNATLPGKTCASISNQVFAVYVAELFPTDIRNTALGTGNTFGRLGALFGNLIIGSPVLAHFDLVMLGLTYLG